jgi:tetratricopeptide (TPR) repeat protein
LASPPKHGRNDACHCGSGRKFKLCCGSAPTHAASQSSFARQSTTSIATGPQFLAARQARQAGRLEEAIAILDRIASVCPDDPRLLQELGAAYFDSRAMSAAVACFRRAVSLDGRLVSAHRGLARALHRLGDADHAIVAYRRAIELSPRDAESLSHLGNLLHGLGRRTEAAECFRRCASVAPNTPAGQLARAKSLLADGDPTRGEAQLRRAIVLNPNYAEAHRLLGTVLAQGGRFEEAVASLERSLALDPGQATAWHDLVRCRKIREADRPWIEQMLTRLQRRDLTGPQRMLLHFALGKSFDDLADYPTAIRHFDAANAIKLRLVPYDSAALSRMVDQAISLFTPAFMARNDLLGSDSEVPLVILGMPRSGTTLVEQIVSNHPAVAAGGELGFWGTRGAVAVEGLRTGDAGPARLGALAYLQALRAISGDAPMVTDKTPYNFFWLGLIRLLFPRARLIHCRRDAVDTCLSIYTTHFAVPAEFSSDRGNLSAYYQQYRRLMAHWRETLPPDTFLDVDYEALVADPEPVTRRMLDHCGLDWSSSCLAPETNQREIRTASVWQARQAIYRSSTQRARHYEPWLGELRTLDAMA